MPCTLQASQRPVATCTGCQRNAVCSLIRPAVFGAHSPGSRLRQHQMRWRQQRPVCAQSQVSVAQASNAVYMHYGGTQPDFICSNLIMHKCLQKSGATAVVEKAVSAAEHAVDQLPSSSEIQRNALEAVEELVQPEQLAQKRLKRKQQKAR